VRALFLGPECRLLALFGRHNRTLECLLLGEERKSRLRRSTSESDPNATLAISKDISFDRPRRIPILGGGHAAARVRWLLALRLNAPSIEVLGQQVNK
jgi:hypothetical protein